jgi:hypothetical protein
MNRIFSKGASVLLILPIVAWAGFFLFATRLSAILSNRYGAQIIARSDEKFNNVETFLHGRMREGALLLTAACLLLLLQRLASTYINRRFRPPARWILRGWSAFLCFNGFVAVAASTILFWGLLYCGKGRTNNYTQWQIKQRLMRECDAPAQVVLLGASQTHSQIDPKILNKRLGPKIWTTELHFPGSTPYDMTIHFSRIPKKNLKYVITYMSEGSFFGGRVDDRLPYFFGFLDLADYWSFGPGRPLFDAHAVSGLFGDIFPVYEIWEPLMERVRNYSVQAEKQARYAASLDPDLAERAKLVTGFYTRSSVTQFEKNAFIALADRCRNAGARLIVCCGQLNPILARALDPSLRPEMLAFLRHEAQNNPNIILFDESQLPLQTEEDYTDLTHVKPETRVRCSNFIADKLEELTVLASHGN